MSLFAAPQSSSILPVAGRLNAPSVLFSERPRKTLAKMVMRRQFQRAFAGVGRAPPGGGGGGGGAPAMIITPGPIIIGPPGPGLATLKLMLVPRFTVWARELASPSTS